MAVLSCMTDRDACRCSCISVALFDGKDHRRVSRRRLSIIGLFNGET